MLIDWLYLNEAVLNNYISIVEGGLRSGIESTARAGKGFDGGLSTPAARLTGGKHDEESSTVSAADTNAARLVRLLEAGREHSEELRWNDVLEAEAVMPSLRPGDILDWECEVYIPEQLRALSDIKGLTQTMDAVSAMAEAVEAITPMQDLPSASEVTAMKKMASSVEVSPAVVGDEDESEWRVVGSVQPEGIAEGAVFDGRARIIGKVREVVSADRWYPLGALPGMNFMPREERRRIKREGPRDGEDENVAVKGPVVAVEYLAIFT